MASLSLVAYDDVGSSGGSSAGEDEEDSIAEKQQEQKKKSPSEEELLHLKTIPSTFKNKLSSTALALAPAVATKVCFLYIDY